MQRILSQFQSIFTSAAALIVFVVLSRWLPHPANVTGLLAVAIFSGVSFSKNHFKKDLFWQTIVAVLVPVLALFVSDLLLGSHETIAYVYGSVALISVLSMLLSQSSFFKSLEKAFGSSALLAKSLGLGSWTVASSLLFFVITNFGVWFEMNMYPKTSSGLLACYVAAIPFLNQQLLGDLLFTGFLFTAAHLSARLGMFAQQSER